MILLGDTYYSVCAAAHTPGRSVPHTPRGLTKKQPGCFNKKYGRENREFTMDSQTTPSS